MCPVTCYLFAHLLPYPNLAVYFSLITLSFTSTFLFSSIPTLFFIFSHPFFYSFTISAFLSLTLSNLSTFLLSSSVLVFPSFYLLLLHFLFSIASLSRCHLPSLYSFSIISSLQLHINFICLTFQPHSEPFLNLGLYFTHLSPPLQASVLVPLIYFPFSPFLVLPLLYPSPRTPSQSSPYPLPGPHTYVYTSILKRSKCFVVTVDFLCLSPLFPIFSYCRFCVIKYMLFLLACFSFFFSYLFFFIFAVSPFFFLSLYFPRLKGSKCVAI